MLTRISLFRDGGKALEENMTFKQRKELEGKMVAVMPFEVLDVGCGEAPRGTVNVDISRYTAETDEEVFKYRLRSGKQDRLVKTKANILAVGEYLPFKDNVFDKVVSFHVIEHCDNPSLFLKELIRVSKYEVEIRCPHRYSGAAKMPFHKHFFSVMWFRTSLKRLNVSHKVDVNYKRFPNSLFGLNVINEIVVNAWKT
jgi:SAM-dependent methyltransferase